MERSTKMFRVTLVGAAFLVAAGCAETQPSNFYLLSPLPPSAAGSLGLEGDKLSLGVGPVTLPGYLDRPQVVSFASSNKLKLAEFHKWAEPLEENFSRVLTENLSVLLASDDVASLPRRRSGRLDYQVVVDVIRFDADLEGTAFLVSRWRVLGRDGKKLLLTRKSSFVEATPFTNDPEAVVAAMSRNVTSLSREIASALLTLQRK